ncbi:translation-associated GTPase [Roseobacter denitrificans]|uniref:Membrane protein, putative n=1 Tax=Roseobacter denitrificans (strain ATCC 33942 / OCh 114) TaxID=375451 RepID=Q165X8_ROSDO|nr:EamA family transporter [Roseobacter denitrificans]ABG32215.1 membrane protein, putative [Roseobacter denitrificans OCh 114]AVL51711.1 translation-associated GTPase [Roseobacter denitrificans]SFF78810.1 EamA-like transporter family protein [Roseobacter denitrificans OCh 114]
MSSPFIIVVALFSWATLLVVSRVVLLRFGLDPWLFTFIQMMAGGAFLLAVSGRSIRAWGLLRDPVIWVYGVLRVATAAFFTASLIYTTAANAAFLSILSVPTSVVLLWFIAARRPQAGEFPGHFLVLLGMVLLTSQLDGAWRNPAVLLMIASELCVVLSTFIAEKHPVNQTRNPRARAGLTGVMLLVSSFVMLLCALTAGAALSQIPLLGTTMLSGPIWLTDPLVVLNPVLWVSAILVGVALRGPSMFVALAAIHRVRTENYLAGMAALPLVSLALEKAATGLGLLDPVPLDGPTTLCGVVMVTGSLLVIWSRHKRNGRERATGAPNTTE